MARTEQFDSAFHVSIDLWYPECWEIEITERLDVGILGYGIYMTGGEVATLFTIYADDHESVTEGIEAIRASEHVHSVSIGVRLSTGSPHEGLSHSFAE